MSERPNTNPPAELPRVMGLRDVVLFNITAIVGLRWLTTAASQFGVAALPLWRFNLQPRPRRIATAGETLPRLRGRASSRCCLRL